MRWSFSPLTIASFLGLLALACSSDPAISSVAADASGDETATSDIDGGPEGDGTTRDGSAPGGTSIDATINSVSRTLDRAQFGNSVGDAQASTLYIESHEGGLPECPTQSSPSPKRTLIIANVPRGAPGSAYTKADGVTVSLLDFMGDQLQGNKPVTTATSATVTIVTIDGDKSVELDIDATFGEGTAKGHVLATFCPSLSD